MNEKYILASKHVSIEQSFYITSNFYPRHLLQACNGFAAQTGGEFTNMTLYTMCVGNWILAGMSTVHLPILTIPKFFLLFAMYTCFITEYVLIGCLVHQHIYENG